MRLLFSAEVGIAYKLRRYFIKHYFYISIVTSPVGVEIKPLLNVSDAIYSFLQFLLFHEEVRQVIYSYRVNLLILL